ncbi:competence system putative prepilin ComGE [Floricoccus tropicus]|nr:competence system putative prepilin ComGE [Floricoccus tropicus]
MLTTIILFEVDRSRRQHTELLRQAEVLNVAKMAYDSEINDLQINGVSVKIVKSETTIKIYDNQKEVLKLEFK